MLEEMLGNWRRGQRGPLPQLTSLQLFNALILIDQKAPLGRRALAQALEINDGVARGLLERLGEQGIVEVNETGVRLSIRGKTRLHSLLAELSIRKIQSLDESDLVPGKSATAIHLGEKYRSGMTGIPQRDEAVRSGAQGSITIAVQRGRLVIPPDNRDAADLSPREDKRLRGLFDLSENDLIVVGFADNTRRSLSGALAAVLSLAAAKS